MSHCETMNYLQPYSHFVSRSLPYRYINEKCSGADFISSSNSECYSKDTHAMYTELNRIDSLPILLVKKFPFGQLLLCRTLSFFPLLPSFSNCLPLPLLRFCFFPYFNFSTSSSTSLFRPILLSTCHLFISCKCVLV